VEERREANQAIVEAQAAQAEAKMARAEGSLASQRTKEWEARFNALCGRVEKAEASTRSEVERTRAQLVDSYRELGARTTDFEVPDREAGLRFLEWLQEELLVLLTIMEGFMSVASLVTCKGAMNALSREGCRHYEVFDQADESFEREIFKAEDPVVKQSAGALFDRMWGAHGREAVRERSDRTREQVMVIVLLWFVVRGYMWCLLNECACAADGVRRRRRGLRESSRRATRGCGGKPVLPSDAGEGPSDAPVPAAAGEDPVLAAVSTAEGAQEVVAEPAVEGPTTAAAPSQVAK
jgi:hypothetical protein